MFIAQSFAGGERPIICKRFLQAPYYRALQAEMQIPNRAPGLVVENVAVANVHSAGEGCLSINYENLSVIAQIDCRHSPGLQRGYWKELCKRNLCLAQSVGDWRPRIACACGVN